MRRRRGGYSSYDEPPLISEFEYYNNKKKVISKKVINELKKRLDEEDCIFWTNDLFAEHKIYFKLTKSGEDKFIRIVESRYSFKPEDILGLKDIFEKRYFLHFDMDSDTAWVLEDLTSDSYNHRYYDDNHDGESVVVFHNVEQLKESLLKNNFFKTYDWKYLDDMQKIYGVFFPGREIPNTPKFRSVSKGWRSKEAYYILDVIEQRYDDKNYRFALMHNPHERYEDGQGQYKLFAYDEEDPLYFQMDVGRLAVNIGDRRPFFIERSEFEYSSDNRLIINRNLMKLFSSDIERVLAKDQYVIPPAIYRFYRDKVLVFNDNDYGPLTEQELQILERYKVIINSDRQVKANNLIIGKNIIKLDNENFVLEFGADFMDVSEHLSKIKSILKEEDVRYNFNNMYEKLLEMSVLKIIDMDNTHERKYKDFEEVSFKLNGMKITVEKDENNRIRINDIFCRIADLHHLLSRAICYTDIEEYNKYIKDVSYIGAEWMRLISSGIAIKLSNPFIDVFRKVTEKNLSNETLIRFSLTRDIKKRNVIYLHLNGVKYPIRYKAKFKRHFDIPNTFMSIKELKRNLSECIDGIDDSKILEIVDNAVEEGRIIQQRGEELVRETIKDIKAEEVEHDINGNMIKGYLLTGRKTGTKYFIAKDNGLSVYRYQDGRWNRRCVVDDYSKQRIYEDRVANRLVNIYNEPAYIHTL